MDPRSEEGTVNYIEIPGVNLRLQEKFCHNKKFHTSRIIWANPLRQDPPVTSVHFCEIYIERKVFSPITSYMVEG